MIGVAKFKDVFRPGEDETSDQIVLALTVHIIHRGKDVLYLAEAGLTVRFLRPGKGAGDIGLIKDLEGKVF